MGLSDRDYYRDDQSGFQLGGNWSAVATLIAVNAAVFLADAFTQGHWVITHLALGTQGFFHRPTEYYQLLTYGFVHDPSEIWHLAFNMFGLWFFGREVEGIYGKVEFYKLYISLIILAGLFNTVIDTAADNHSILLGASGGVVGLAVIFACHFPRRSLMMIPIPIPIPAYLFVSGYVLIEFLSTIGKSGDNVAHWAHLGGAAFGFLYYKTGWNLFRWLPRTGKWNAKATWRKMPWSKPKFRIHTEPEEFEEPPDDYLSTGKVKQRVDQLLEKISTSGEASLTDEERRFLSDASRRYQQQRRR